MSNRGIPEAESDDQTWMPPPKRAPLPRAGYSDFNPPPLDSRPSPEAESAKYTWLIYRFLVGAAIGGLVGIAVYLIFLT